MCRRMSHWSLETSRFVGRGAYKDMSVKVAGLTTQRSYIYVVPL